jgi:uncharacterized membrane protein
MLRIILVIYIFCVSCSFAMLSSEQGEIDYDKMVRESREFKNYTPADIARMEKERREAKNERLRLVMKGYERPRIASQTRKIDATGEKDGTKGGEILSRNTIIAIIVLIIGVFMLLYSHSSFSRKNTG